MTIRSRRPWSEPWEPRGLPVSGTPAKMQAPAFQSGPTFPGKVQTYQARSLLLPPLPSSEVSTIAKQSTTLRTSAPELYRVAACIKARVSGTPTKMQDPAVQSGVCKSTEWKGGSTNDPLVADSRSNSISGRKPESVRQVSGVPYAPARNIPPPGVSGKVQKYQPSPSPSC